MFKFIGSAAVLVFFVFDSELMIMCSSLSYNVMLLRMNGTLQAPDACWYLVLLVPSLPASASGGGGGM